MTNECLSKNFTLIRAHTLPTASASGGSVLSLICNAILTLVFRIPWPRGEIPR